MSVASGFGAYYLELGIKVGIAILVLSVGIFLLLITYLHKQSTSDVCKYGFHSFSEVDITQDNKAVSKCDFCSKVFVKEIERESK